MKVNDEHVSPLLDWHFIGHHLPSVWHEAWLEQVIVIFTEWILGSSHCLDGLDEYVPVSITAQFKQRGVQVVFLHIDETESLSLVKGLMSI